MNFQEEQVLLKKYKKVQINLIKCNIHYQLTILSLKIIPYHLNKFQTYLKLINN